MRLRMVVLIPLVEWSEFIEGGTMGWFLLITSGFKYLAGIWLL